MRTLFLAVGLVAAAALALAGRSASANGGPHGGYTTFSDSHRCAACHRAHTAVGARLIVEPTIEALCRDCHYGGAGADTDPWNGKLSGYPSVWLNGGGFDKINDIPTTSRHRTGQGVAGTAWGGASSGTGAVGVLECTSCHNPHGSTNYRLLRDADNGTVRGEGLENAFRYRWDYVDGVTNTPADTNTLDWQSNQVLEVSPTYFGFRGVNSVHATDGMANYTQGMNRWCATCHKQYVTGQGSARVPSDTVGSNPLTGQPYYYHPGTQDALDGWGDIARYRHEVDRVVDLSFPPTMKYRLRLSSPGDASYWDPVYQEGDPNAQYRTGITCLTCHYAHGTTVSMTGYAANPSSGVGTGRQTSGGFTLGATIPPTADSALLYLGNRGVCNACHQKDK